MATLATVNPQDKAQPVRRTSATPLAWRNLIHDRRRLALAVGGIGFAVLLMFMQLGFRGALLESTVTFLKSLNGDILLVSNKRFTLVVQQSFPRTALYQAEGAAGVKAAYPIYIDNQRSNWRLSEDWPRSLPIRTIAFDPSQPIFVSNRLSQQVQALSERDTLMFDARAKSDYGRPTPGNDAWLMGRGIKVVGLFELGTDFATDATVFVSDQTFRRWFALPGVNDDPLKNVDVGVVQLKPGQDAKLVKQELIERLPANILVRTKAEYVADEQGFWNRSTPVGFIFGFGVVLGFIVGVVICYQILFADVTDHFPEYATLMAMGYRSPFFRKVILQQSLLLSIMAFVPAILLAWMMYAFLSLATGLAFDLRIDRMVIVLLLTLAMCATSGLLALRRLLSAEPAELFR